MARSNIHFHDKRNELIQVALQLFLEKGYEDTTISDVMKEANISKGALYHYFTSKEEILDAVLAFLMDMDLKRVECIVEDKSISAVDKLKMLLAAGEQKNDDIKKVENDFQEIRKSLFHYRLKEESFLHTSKVIAKVIRQGIEQGVFTTTQPDEMSEFVSSALQAIIVLAEATPESGVSYLDTRIEAFIRLMELCFGTSPGLLNDIHKPLHQQIKVYLANGGNS